MARKSSRQTHDLSVVGRREELFETTFREIRFDRPLAPLLLRLLREGPSPQCEQAARIAAMSISTLRRECRAAFGTSYAPLRDAFGLERAADRAFSRRFTCKMIATEAGFGTVEAFCRAFKRRFGVSSTEFTPPRGARTLASFLRELERVLEGLE